MLKIRHPIKLTIDSSVSPVGSPPQTWRAVDLNVVDHKTVDIKSLVVCIGLSVLQQLKEELG